MRNFVPARARREARYRSATSGWLLKAHAPFWSERFAIFGEQLILQDSVTHSINEFPLPPLGSVLGAAALAVGDKFGGTTCLGSQNPPLPLTVARHCSIVTKPQFAPCCQISIKVCGDVAAGDLPCESHIAAARNRRVIVDHRKSKARLLWRCRQASEETGHPKPDAAFVGQGTGCCGRDGGTSKRRGDKT